MNINSATWQELNKKGLIPGPDETQEQFLRRASFCQNLLQELSTRVSKELPFDLSDTACRKITEDALHLSEKIYGIAPDWVPIFFSNYQLSMWHGGCAWIFQLDEQTPTSAFLQLRKNFKSKNWYRGIYNRKELIVHEYAHVGRMLYQEPQFEEILAYRSSDSRFRRFFGPLIQSSKESLFFTFLLGMILITEFAFFVVDSPFTSIAAIGLLIIPVLFIILALMRLFKKQMQFNLCLKKLQKIYCNRVIAKHLIYRLTDKEIQLFAHLKSLEIVNYIHSHQFTHFRWDFLSKNYPLP